MSENPQPRRLSCPEAETSDPRLGALGALIDAYHQIDIGVQEATRREVHQGRTLACVKGCAACCRSHQDIPVHPLEIMGLYRYCVEQLREPARERLRQRLARAEDRLLPFHGIRRKGERRAAIRDGRIHALARVMLSIDWSRLAQRMAGPGRILPVNDKKGLPMGSPHPAANP